MPKRVQETSDTDQLTAERDALAVAVERWVAEQATALRMLAGLLALDEMDQLTLSPERVDALAAEIGQLRGRLEILERAIARDSRRYLDAARAVVLAEADALDGEVMEAQQTLTDFETRRDELLAALQEHAGGTWTCKGGREHTLALVVGEVQERQRQLRASAERVEPLRIASVELAEASLKAGELSPASRANLLAVADTLEAQARTLEDEQGQLIWDLKQAWQMSGGSIAAGSLDDHVVYSWEPDSEASQAAQEHARELGAEMARLRAQAAVWAAAAAPERQLVAAH